MFDPANREFLADDAMPGKILFDQLSHDGFRRPTPIPPSVRCARALPFTTTIASADGS